jgi:transcriptional regulator of acetoin/glycerol metabolism
MAEAAQTLGIQRPNLYRKARQLGIPLARLSE